MTLNNKRKKTLTIMTSTILLTSLAVLAIQVHTIDTENLIPNVFAGSIPTINPGDILVALEPIDEFASIIVVDSQTGQQTFFVTLSEEPVDMKIDSAGDLIIAAESGILRLDTITGIETVIANYEDAFLSEPTSIDLNAAGDILVLDNDGLINGTIIKVDPVSGAETLIVSNTLLLGANAIAVESSGDILVLNFEILYRVDPIGGTVTELTNDVLDGTEELIRNDAGDIFSVGGNVVKIDPITGIATVISSGFPGITGIGLESDNSLIVVESDEDSIVYRVDPVSGAQTVVSSNDLLTGAFATALTVFPSTQLDPDTDGDGIFNEVDILPNTFSDDFNDLSLGGTSDGSIMDRGNQILTITEEANPDGIRVNADISGGATPATVEFCSVMSSIDFDPGDESVVTCSSVTVTTISGPLSITFFGADDTEAITILTQGNSITFDQDTFSFTTPSTNAETVIVSVNGIDTSIEPGSTISVPLQTAYPDSDPTLRWVNGIGEEPCTDLNTFNCVDETLRDDNDYIQTIGLGKNNSDKQFYTLSDMTDPMTSEGHVLRYTIQEADVGVNPVKLDVILRQGETIIASFPHENLPTGFTLIEQTLTSVQADSITDYSDLELTLDGNCDNTCKNSPGNREKIQVSWIEFAIMATS